MSIRGFFRRLLQTDMERMGEEDRQMVAEGRLAADQADAVATRLFALEIENDQLKDHLRFFFRLIDQKHLVRRRPDTEEIERRLGEIAELVWDEGGGERT